MSKKKSESKAIKDLKGLSSITQSTAGLQHYFEMRGGFCLHRQISLSCALTVVSR